MWLLREQFLYFLNRPIIAKVSQIPNIRLRAYILIFCTLLTNQYFNNLSFHQIKISSHVRPTTSGCSSCITVTSRRTDGGDLIRSGERDSPVLYTADQRHHILMILTCVRGSKGGWPKTAGCSEVGKGGREGLLIENKMFNKNFIFVSTNDSEEDRHLLNNIK